MRGAKNMEMKKKKPVAHAARPVRAPSRMPAALSM